MSRLTPFALVFGDVAGELGDLTAAGARAGRDPRDLEEFARIPEAQRLLARLEAPALLAEHPEAGEEYLSLLHCAYRFHAGGAHVAAPSAERLLAVLAQRPPAALPIVPGGAAYLQLPPNRFWGQAAEGTPHEPIDGMFLVESPRGDEVTILTVLGLRAEREGFTQVTLRARAADFAAARAVRREPPFAPLMDGGAAAGMYSVANPAELLTLAHLAMLAAAK
jgi:hypothetical protein